MVKVPHSKMPTIEPSTFVFMKSNRKKICVQLKKKEERDGKSTWKRRTTMKKNNARDAKKNED